MEAESARRLLKLDVAKYADRYADYLDADDIAKLGTEHESLLVRLADGGSKPAAKRLVKLNTAAYADRYLIRFAKQYPRDMFGEDIARALRMGVLSQEALGIVAAKWLDDRHARTIATDALEQIVDTDVLASLLMRNPDEMLRGQYRWWCNDKFRDWYMLLVNKLKDRQDVLADYVLSDLQPCMDVKRQAFDLIYSASELIRIAKSEHYNALEAAELLSVDAMPELVQEASYRKVRDYARAEIYTYRIAHEELSDDELLELLEWCHTATIGQEERLRLTEHALRKLQGQDALLGALRSERYEYATDMLLPRITDVDGLRAICLEFESFDMYWDRELWGKVTQRLAEMISGTPEADAFVSELRKLLLDGSPVDRASDRALCVASVFLGMSEGEAALEVGGDEYVSHLIAEICTQRGELGRTRAAEQRLAQMYTDISSHPRLAQLRGTTYPKHVDVYDGQCASDSCDTVVDYVVNI